MKLHTKNIVLLQAMAFAATIFAADIAAAQTTVNLTAHRTSATLPGSPAAIPMWGYCGDIDANSTGGAVAAVSCNNTWSPGPTITVAAGESLTINLTNGLPTPTSLWIQGQLGGELGKPVYNMVSPLHGTQSITTFPGVGDGTFTPPAQGDRVRSFVPEAPVGGVVKSYSWNSLKPGTYLYSTATFPSIQQPMGLYGLLIVTAPGATYPGVDYDAETAFLYSEIDPAQNALVDTMIVNAAACTPIVGPCGGVIDDAEQVAAPAAGGYPPAVNYSPRYFLINGLAFDKAHISNSIYSIANSYNSGNVLVRFANAGSRTHVPAFVGLPMTLLAEDSHIAPGNPKIQNEVNLEAGKTRDVVIKPANNSTAYTDANYALFDRQLSMTNNNEGNGGMQGFIKVGAGGGTINTSGTVAAPFAVNDTYSSAAGTTFNGNVITNPQGKDILVTTVAAVNAPLHGTLALNSDGSFIYTPDTFFAGVDSFTYIGNGGTTNAAKVTLNVTDLPFAGDDAYTSKVAKSLKIARPGVLVNDTDAVGYTLVAKPDPAHALPAWLTLNEDGSMVAAPPAPGNYTFTYVAQNSLGVVSVPATVTLNFPAGSGLNLTVQDTQDPNLIITDYRWVIEEDTTYKNNPLNPTQANTCTPQQAAAGACTPPQSLATEFHKSYMPVVATGCTGDLSCGAAQPSTQQLPTSVGDVVLDPNKNYFVSVLSGDAGNPDVNGMGHAMAGTPIPAGQLNVTALAPRNPLPPAQLSIFVFEDNQPTNGDVDQGEVGLGGFRIEFADTRGSSGDVAGTITYDALAMPLTNSLMDGTNLDCPKLPGASEVGVVITCPNKRADGTVSPLAGMALVKNMIPGRIDVFASPSAERVAGGEKWIQISTLEGTHANDTFSKPGEPAYWQEFGSPGFHSIVGFVNPDHVKQQHDLVASAATGTVTGRITSLHMDRPPLAKLNNSCQPGSDDPTCARAALSYTNCYVALNSLAGEGPNLAMSHCDDNGNFTLTGVPNGDYILFIWDDWLDQIKAMKTVTVASQNVPVAVGDVPVFSWFTRLEQSIYNDLNKNGVRDAGEPGMSNLPMTIRFRDGTIANLGFTDGNGDATFNEVFPLFNWYVTEADTTRFKGTGVNVTYDAGGLTDKRGNYAGVLNSTETTSLPNGMKVSGAKYTAGTTNRIDPPSIASEGFQGFVNQTQVIDWGRTNYSVGENGGVTGMVYYAPTRGTDDPRLEVQTLWSPGVPRVPVNLYLKKDDGNLQLVDSVTTNSWDDAVAPGSPTQPHCPGNAANDPFIAYTLGKTNQYKCYDGQHSFNQVQPAVYDGRYRFPSADKCKVCTGQIVTNPDGTTKTVPQLPAGTYVVEVSPPTGYEIVKEEDKNIYGGDAWIGPAIQQFPNGFGNIFIMPDQATINSNYNPVYGPANPPCVGNERIVPQYLSLVPEAQQYTPFAGQMRPLCDRKEIRLGDMTQAIADFQVFTPTPVAAHFTGMMLNDAAAEFDPFAPSFGEKAALPNAPVSIRDYNGVEILRTYNDKWGTFNGMLPSTWNANAPNPSGYAENMLTNCMNDPGPIVDRRPGSSTFGQKIIDPMYNPMFSNFCYTWPFMPGTTTYLDTPVLPVAAFASSSSYNPVDCQYPDATPAIRRVDGNAGVGTFGPYIDMSPLAAAKTLTINALGDVDVLNPAYLGPTSTSASTNQPKIKRHYGFGTQGANSVVTLGGITLAVNSWSDSQIVATVPANALTGQLEIIANNGKKTEDAITVTIEDSSVANYRAPTYLNPVSTTDPNSLGLVHPLQDAIDAALPGDFIMLNEGHYPELAIMWKPIRLQGVGAAAVVINAAKYPTTKIENWRARIDPLFGVDALGNPLVGLSQVDPLPGQPVGGVTQMEPTSLATEEGPGILVLAKDPAAIACNDATVAAGLTSVVSQSNFTCAPSRIDGLTVTGGDSGGGVYVNGWAHNLEISNNRIYGNAGTVNGGLRIGQEGLEGQVPGVNGGLGYDVNVRIHNNAISTNGTVEANAAVLTPSGAAPGGIAIFAGSDNYQVTNNWVCGNYSSGDGGGVAHIGLSLNGTISDNKILFNQSYNQGATVNGGGLAIEGESPTGTALTLGSGNVIVDSNLIMGNFAQSGSGGGVELFRVNGNDVAQSNNVNSWWKITMTNNIITNNVAGWSGGGISMADTLNSSIINNTVVSNDSTGIAGALFSTMVGNVNSGPSTTVPSPAGVSSELTSAALLAAVPVALVNANNNISKPTLTNNVVWHNRSFFFDMSTGVTRILPSNNWNDAVTLDANNHVVGSELTAQHSTGECVAGGKYWDMGVIGDMSPTPGVNALQPDYSILSSVAGYAVSNMATDPGLKKVYCNGSRVQPGAQFEPATPFLPNFQLNPAATLDESGNFVDLHYGPLSLTDPALPASTALVGDAHLANATSSAYNAGTLNGAPAADFDHGTRPQANVIDVGADEIAFVSVTPRALNLGSAQVEEPTNAMSVTIKNIGAVVLNFGGATFTGALAADFTSSSNTCGASLAVGASCTVNVVLTPSVVGNESATMNLNLTGSLGAITISEAVAVSGTGLEAVGIVAIP
jgi:Bacterial Ig domain